jgi:cell division protein FtsN
MKKSAPRNTLQRQDTAPKKSGGGILLGLFLGLVVGMLIAFGVVWYMNKAQLPFQTNKYEGASSPAAKTKEAKEAKNENSTEKTPLQLPGKPGDKIGEKPRFDFYGILEGKQTATPAAVPPAPTSAQTSAPSPTNSTPISPKPGTVFYLQAGAFPKSGDAENLKAKLAMLGVEANVQEATLPDKGKMHRVRIGPISSPDEMNRVRSELAQSGIQATVVNKPKD